jgi:UDP-glucose 4-epimerase
MRVLVTAATGFIGAYCVQYLLDHGCEVLATGRNSLGLEYYRSKGIPCAKLDVTDRSDFDSLPEVHIDAVIHAAGLVPSNVSESDYDPRKYVEINTLGTLNLLEFCKNRGIKTILYTHSHSDVEGYWDSGSKIPSDSPRSYSLTGDHAVYIISKNAAVDCIGHYAQQFGMRGIIFRLPPVYGFGPHTTIFKDGRRLRTGFEIFMDRAGKGEDLEVWGNASVGRDIISVWDVAEACHLALSDERASGVYNIASGYALTLEEEARTMIEVFSPADKRSKIVFRPEKKNSLRGFVYDISKAKNDFGWVPKHDFKDILIDSKREGEDGRFNFLIEKKKKIMGSK